MAMIFIRAHGAFVQSWALGVVLSAVTVAAMQVRSMLLAFTCSIPRNFARQYSSLSV